MPPSVPPSRPNPGLSAQLRIAFKLGVIAVLIVLLCVPLLLIGGVLHERLQRRDEAIRDITSTWGQPQSIVGPVLNVPYRYSFQTWKEDVVGGRRQEVQVTETAVATAHFLPETLTANGRMDPMVLHRGIYEAVVYAGELTLTGRFPRPDLSAWEVAAEDILWEEATVSVGVTDLRGTRGALHLTFADAEVLLTPGTGLDAAPLGVRARVGTLAKDGDELTFALTLDCNGSGGLFVAPVGMETRVQLQAPWPDPKFTGAFLPARRTVTADGFNAEWEVSFYGRSYPQQWSSRESPGAF